MQSRLLFVDTYNLAIIDAAIILHFLYVYVASCASETRSFFLDKLVSNFAVCTLNV